VTIPASSDQGVHSADGDSLPKRGRRILRILAWLFIGLLSLVAIAGIGIAAGWVYYHPAYEAEKGVVYGVRKGKNLTFDVVRPAKPNGLGIVYFTSAGWHSRGPGSGPVLDPKASASMPSRRRSVTKRLESGGLSSCGNARWLPWRKPPLYDRAFRAGECR